MWASSRSFSIRATRVFSTVAGEGVAGRAEQVKGAAKEFSKSTSASSGLWGKLRKDHQSQHQKGPSGQNNQNRGPQQQRSNSGKRQHNRPPRKASAAPAAAGAAAGGAAPTAPQSAPRKVYNNRTAYKGKKPFKPAPAGAGGGAGTRGDAPRKPRRESGKSWNRVPEAMLPLLLDHEFFEEKAKLGHGVIDSTMDPLDSFLSHAFMGSLKTRDHTHQQFIENDLLKRVHIPKPRSMVQLQSAMLPPVLNVPAGSSAHNLATSAWNVVSKNYYYSPRQQVDLATGIAAQMLALQQRMDASIDESDPSMDMIFDPEFSKGIPGIEREKRAKMMLEQGNEEDFGLTKGETDWDVAAVEDEDQL